MQKRVSSSLIPHSVKSVHIRSYSDPYFPAFGLNTDRYGESLRIQSECGKIRTRITANTDNQNNGTSHFCHFKYCWHTKYLSQAHLLFLPKSYLLWKTPHCKIHVSSFRPLNTMEHIRHGTKSLMLHVRFKRNYLRLTKKTCKPLQLSRAQNKCPTRNCLYPIRMKQNWALSPARKLSFQKVFFTNNNNRKENEWKKGEISENSCFYLWKRKTQFSQYFENCFECFFTYFRLVLNYSYGQSIWDKL